MASNKWLASECFLKEWRQMCCMYFFELTSENVGQIVKAFKELYYNVFSGDRSLLYVEEIMQIISNAADAITFFPKMEEVQASNNGNNNSNNDITVTDLSADLLKTQTHLTKDIKVELADLLNNLIDLYASKEVIACSFAIALTSKIIGFFDDNAISIFVENLSSITEVYTKLFNPVLICSIILFIQKMFAIRNFFSTQSTTNEVRSQHNVIHFGLIEIILILLRQITFTADVSTPFEASTSITDDKEDKQEKNIQLHNVFFVQRLAATIFKNLLSGIEYKPPRTKILHMIELYTHLAFISNTNSSVTEGSCPLSELTGRSFPSSLAQDSMSISNLMNIYEKYSTYSQTQPLVHQINFFHKINSRYIIDNILNEIIISLGAYSDSAISNFIKKSCNETKVSNDNITNDSLGAMVKKRKKVDVTAIVILLDSLRNEIMLKCILTSPIYVSKFLSWTTSVLLTQSSLFPISIRNSARGFLTAILFIDFMLPIPKDYKVPDSNNSVENNNGPLEKTEEIRVVLRSALSNDIEREKLKYIVENGFAKYLEYFGIHPRAVKPLELKKFL